MKTKTEFETLYRLNCFTIEVLNRLPEKYKFKHNDAFVKNHIFFIYVISPDKTRCAIASLNNKIDKISDDALKGAIAHELAHFWIQQDEQVYNDYWKVAPIYNKVMALFNKGKIKEAKILKKKGDKILKNKRINRNFNEYIRVEHKTDNFASEKFGFKKEIKAMKKVVEEDFTEISLRFFPY